MGLFTFRWTAEHNTVTAVGRFMVESGWNVMAHGDAREGKRRGTWRIEWIASTLHTTSEHGVSSITTADAHTSAASSRLNWRPWGFKWTRPFRRNTKYVFCACAITFQLASTAAPPPKIFLPECNSHGRAGASSLRRFSLTLTHTTLGKTPLDEWSARRRDLYLTPQNTHKRYPCPPAGFEPALPACNRPQTHAMDRAATGERCLTVYHI